MTANTTARLTDPPQAGFSALDAATVIRTLGARLIDIYGAVSDGSNERQPNPWGSKQREQLLRALIERVALHARTFENAALSATETALTLFAREQFKKSGGTRSQRDRKPIERNLDKVIGGWLRRFGRRLRQNVVVVTSKGRVDLRDRRGEFRLTLTFAYPWRLVTNRKLQITAKLEAIDASGASTVLPFPSNVDADAVALPEGRSLRPEEARAVAGMFQHMKDLAAAFKYPELADFAEQGLQMFTPKLNVKKAAAALLLVVALGAAASPPARRFAARLYDAIVSSGSLGEVLEKLRIDSEQGVFVTPTGAQSQVAQSGHGSQVRVSPGKSPELLHIEASITGKDLSELKEQLVPLRALTEAGVIAMQYRSAPKEPIVPWVLEVIVAPDQDADLAAELARQTASVTITYDPPLEKAELTRIQNVSLSGKRLSMLSELRELPHKRQSYRITGKVVRESGASEVYRAELHVDENGFATLEREKGARLTGISEDVKVGHPICTTIVQDQALPMHIPGQKDYVWALAKPFQEQDVILIVYPLSSDSGVEEITVDWGDGSRADRELEKGLFIPVHSYRVGDRAYPITIYFKGSKVVFKFDLYVFSRQAAKELVLDYVTPYPPNPELTDLANAGAHKPEIVVNVRKGPVRTESITYSRHRDPWVWQVPLEHRKPKDRLLVRYFWRHGEIVQLPE